MLHDSMLPLYVMLLDRLVAKAPKQTELFLTAVTLPRT